MSEVKEQNAYKYGFVTDIESERAPKGLNPDIIRFISEKKNEPEWLLDFRLKALEQWQKMVEPSWAHINYSPIDFQDISYYSAPKKKKDPINGLDEVDPELIKTFERLGIPLAEQNGLQA